jgi:hypothetical protein
MEGPGARFLLEACEERNVTLEAYSPLGTGRHLSDGRVRQIAEGVSRTPAQVLLRWCVQRDLPVIPKSTHRDRIEENAEIVDFALSDENMAALDALDENGRHRIDVIGFADADIDAEMARDEDAEEFDAEMARPRHRGRGQVVAPEGPGWESTSDRWWSSSRVRCSPTTDPSRSLGTSMSTGPTSVTTVLDRLPLREFDVDRPAGSFFG